VRVNRATRSLSHHHVDIDQRFHLRIRAHPDEPKPSEVTRKVLRIGLTRS
jgi:hypothetical protein